MLAKVLCLVGGLLIGGGLTTFFSGNSYLNGKLAACKEFVDGMNRTAPVELSCFIEKGEVFVRTPLAPELKFTLDGRPLENR